MVDNGNASQAGTTAPKQTEKTTVVGGQVTIETGTFDPASPLLLDQAADVFKSQVAERYGEKAVVTNLAVTVSVHKVGEHVVYDVTGEVNG